MGQPIRVTVHSDLRSGELLSYMQGIACSELGKTQFLMNTLYKLCSSKFDMVHIFEYYFQRQIDFKWSQHDKGWSRCSLTPSVTLLSPTLGSSASKTYVHQKLMFIWYFSIINPFKMVPRWPWCSRTPSATSSTSTMGVQQVPLMFIKNWHDICLYAIFQKTNWYKSVPTW